MRRLTCTEQLGLAVFLSLVSSRCSVRISVAAWDILVGIFVVFHSPSMYKGWAIMIRPLQCDLRWSIVFWVPRRKYRDSASISYEHLLSNPFKLIVNRLTIRYIVSIGSTRYRSWLRHYTTSRKVAGSISDEVDFFNWPNPSSRTMALGSTQPLTEMSTGNLLGVKGGRQARKADIIIAVYEPIV
jgi:hypothetical protein